MKKTKLILNLSLLLLTFACLTFGVYSAVKTTFTAGGTIIFNAYDMNLDIDMSFAGTETAIENKYVSTHKDRSDHLTSGQAYTDITTGITGLDLTFDEFTIPEGKTAPEYKITITLNVKNYSSFEIMATPTLKFGASGAESTATFESTFTSTLTNGVVDLASQGTAAITIEISPKNTASAITSNNSFKFEIEFKPETNHIDYDKLLSEGYVQLENNVNCIISDGKLSNYVESENSSITKIIIPKGVTIIDGSTFTNASYLTDVIMPIGLTTIRDFAFGGCSGLKSVTIPRTVESIASGAFNSCSSLQEVKFLNNLKSLSEATFADCTSLKSIKLPDGLETLNTECFNNCSQLSEIEIPASLNAVIANGSTLFTNCPNLTTLNFKGTKSQWNAILFNGMQWTSGMGSYTIHCTDGDI